ncbi:MAG: hypothetical protein NTV93_07565 [Verrucomicrobia bacterium]|nr:hypothetical protein [Verrucomicrobiota bacterium]
MHLLVRIRGGMPDKGLEAVFTKRADNTFDQSSREKGDSAWYNQPSGHAALGAEGTGVSVRDVTSFFRKRFHSPNRRRRIGKTVEGFVQDLRNCTDRKTQFLGQAGKRYFWFLHRLSFQHSFFGLEKQACAGNQ